MKQTSIEWVLQYLNNVKPNEFCSIEKIKELLEQAKIMHKQEIIDAANTLLYHSTGQGDTAAEQYYQETFGGKGSDEVKEESLVEKMVPHQLKYNLDVMEKLASTLPQQEISDEEIEKAADKYVSEDDYNRYLECFKQGAKWYREQLKQRQ